MVVIRPLILKLQFGLRSDYAQGNHHGDRFPNVTASL